MSSEKVTEQMLVELRGLFSRTGSDPVRAERVVLAIDELLQRRRDGNSPEEFVVKMAERLKEVAPEVQANFLAHLSTIRDSLLRIRTIEGVSMKPGGWE